MRLSLTVNGTTRVIAALQGPGYLSAYLNLHDRPKDNDHSKTIRISGTQTLETETVWLDWPTLELETQDVVELRVLDEGESDLPSKVRKSSELPNNLFSSPELARELTVLLSDFETRLMQFQEKSKGIEPAKEHEKFTRALGYVLIRSRGEFLVSRVSSAQRAHPGRTERRNPLAPECRGLAVPPP